MSRQHLAWVGGPGRTHSSAPSGLSREGAHSCAQLREDWGKIMAQVHVPVAASKAQVGVLYCPSFLALKFYIY
jgi:hypothetical protein